MARQIPWLRVVVEGAVIVVSILLAFGIDAWWAERQERQEEQLLLTDLIEEFEANRAELASVTERHRQRYERLDVLLREAGPEAEGLGSDSLSLLASRALNLTLFTPERGVMDRALNGNGLSLIADADLRTRLAGFWSRHANFFGNQQTATDANSPTVLFETGTLVIPYPPLPSLGATTMWSNPMTPEQARAFKHFYFISLLTQLMVAQGEAMMVDIDEVLASLRKATDP